MYCSWCDFGEKEPDDCICEEDCGEKDCLGVYVNDDSRDVDEVQ